MLKPEQLRTKGVRGPDAPADPVADSPADAPAEKPPGPAPQQCILCGGAAHVSALVDAAHEVQDCPRCGRAVRDPVIARRAFPA